jgi:sn1-specific diacylglycerol lipase
LALQFGIGRGITSGIARAVGNALDYTFVGGSRGTGDALGELVASAFNTAESIALAPILIGETITSTSLVAASGSLDALSLLFGSDEASFSLASFAQLVRREWQSPVLAEYLPSQRFTVVQMARALIAWAAIQGVTMDYTEQRWFMYLRELTDSEKRPVRSLTRQLSTRDESVHITEDIVLPEQDGQIISADIGSPDSPNPIDDSAVKPSSRAHSRQELLPSLRRLSKLALAGYGGAGMIFFGVPLRPTSEDTTQHPSDEQLQAEEESVLTSAVSSSQRRDTSRSRTRDGTLPIRSAASDAPPFSWWEVLMGKHDRAIFESYAFSTTPAAAAAAGAAATSSKTSNVVLGQEPRMPRFWVITDHSRKEVVLVLRGKIFTNMLMYNSDE